MRYLTFALPKGRLAQDCMARLAQIGVTCDEMEEKTRKLVFTNEERKLRFFLAKATDVPTYVEYGAADIGFVGKDTLLEEQRNLYEVLDMQMGKCSMAVAAREDKWETLRRGSHVVVATKYPNVATDFFYNQKHRTVEIIKLNGSVELGPIVGLADCIVDIVETGTTLRENGLAVVETICDVSARMVVNRVSMKMEHERITDMIVRLKRLVGEKI